MKKHIQWLARLYPAAWRKRYGVEFEALLEDANASWSDLFDVFRGALDIHWTTWGTAKTALAFGMAGAIVAAGVTLSMPKQYVSSAALRLTSPASVDDRFRQLVKLALSDDALKALIKSEGLYLNQAPSEGLIKTLRKDILIRPISRSMPNQPSGLRTAEALVQFQYRDPLKAQQTTNSLIALLHSANINPAISAPVTASNPTLLEQLTPATLPQRSTRLSPFLAAAIGIAIGAFLGILLSAFRRFTRI